MGMLYLLEEMILHVDNIIGAARKTAQNNLLGNCVTSWAVRIHNYETQEPWLYLAPLTIKNYSLTKEELLLLTSEKLFRVKSTDFFQAVNQIGFSFPFANEKSTGIQWTGMKDSKPAPRDYTNSLISKWKESNVWDSVVDRIKKSTDSISEGIVNINNFIPKVGAGITILNNWFTVGYFQYWQSFIANQIVNSVESESAISNEELAQLIYSLKVDYINWAKKWMTTLSSEQNAGLIYDAIQNYFEIN